MKSSSQLFDEQTETRKRQKPRQPMKIAIVCIMILIVVCIISFTTVLIVRESTEKNNATHIHYTRLSKKIYGGKYELYRLDVLKNRNPTGQYKLLADFLRRSLMNRSNYERLLPNCPIILSASLMDHPEDWRAMLFATLKYPRVDMPYPYICFLSVLSTERRQHLGTLLLNRFLNEMKSQTDPKVTHLQLHANWENCHAQALYRRCGFRCNQFTLNGYSPPFERNYKFGHMIRMELAVKHIQRFDDVCYNHTAVSISPTDDQNYIKLCNAGKPVSLLNQTCSTGGKVKGSNRTTQFSTRK